MGRYTIISAFARGALDAAFLWGKTLFSSRVAESLVFDLYRYPFSKIYRTVSVPREGRRLSCGACLVFHLSYGVSAFGLEGIPPYDTHRAARIYESLVRWGVISPQDVYVPTPVTDADLLRIHSRQYIEGLSDPRRLADVLEFPLVSRLPLFMVKRILESFRLAAGGTLIASILAMKYGLAVNLGGGFHHARPDRGAGFCPIADIPVAISMLKDRFGKDMRFLIIDLDVHQGDGTIVCTWGDPNVYTFSMHQAEIFPFPKEAGDMDIEIPAGFSDDEYLSLLSLNLLPVLEEAKPDFVFYIAGADVLAADPLASIELTSEGLARRDSMVVDACKERGIPVVITLGGGYSREAAPAQSESLRRLFSHCRR